MNKIWTVAAVVSATLLVGCATRVPAPKWSGVSDATEAEYVPYRVKGTATLSGQAFAVQQGGGTVKAAGRKVTLDPATTSGTNWWYQAGKTYRFRHALPPSDAFKEVRRTVVADADGRFTFTDLPAGSYYVGTDVTWTVPYHGIQGGVVTTKVEIADGENKSVIVQ